MSDPQALHVTRNVIPGKLGVDLHLHRVHIPLVASVTASADFMLPSRLRHVTDPAVISAQNAWTSLSHVPCPLPPFSSSQKSWDWPLLKLKFNNVMSAAQSPVGRARLLAVASPHSGDFLNAIPCSSIGTRLDNSSFRIATLIGSANWRTKTYVLVRQFALPINASAEKTSTNMALWSVMQAVCRSSFATQRRQ